GGGLRIFRLGTGGDGAHAEYPDASGERFRGRRVQPAHGRVRGARQRGAQLGGGVLSDAQRLRARRQERRKGLRAARRAGNLGGVRCHAPGTSTASSSWLGSGMVMDALSSLWQEWVVNYDW